MLYYCRAAESPLFPLYAEGKGATTMIRHMVMLRKKPDTDEATVQAIMERLEGLYGEIRGLMAIRCYRSASTALSTAFGTSRRQRSRASKASWPSGQTAFISPVHVALTG